MHLVRLLNRTQGRSGLKDEVSNSQKNIRISRSSATSCVSLADLVNQSVSEKVSFSTYIGSNPLWDTILF